MTRKTFLATLITFGLVAITNTGFANQNKLKVEILAFQQADNNARMEENWPLHPGLPNFSQGIPLHELKISKTYTNISKNKKKLSYRLVPKKDLDLNHIEKEMSTSTIYQPIFHTAWVQTVDSNEAYPAIIYDSSKDAEKQLTVPFDDLYNSYQENKKLSLPEFEGTIKLKQSKFTHIDLDFIFREPNFEQPQSEPGQLTNGEVYQYEDYLNSHPWQDIAPYIADKNKLTYYKSYRLTESVRLKPKVVYYVDHPMFGFLIKVTPITISKK